MKASERGDACLKHGCDVDNMCGDATIIMLLYARLQACCIHAAIVGDMIVMLGIWCACYKNVRMMHL